MTEGLKPLHNVTWQSVWLADQEFGFKDTDGFWLLYNGSWDHLVSWFEIGLEIPYLAKTIMLVAVRLANLSWDWHNNALHYHSCNKMDFASFVIIAIGCDTPVPSIYYCCQNFGQNRLLIFEVLTQWKCQSKFCPWTKQEQHTWNFTP